jgi:2-oxoglutarate dehydrogenase complex dehydrogenase (E1) component-like enzyme
MKIRALGEYCKSIGTDCDICENTEECEKLTAQLEEVSPYGLIKLLDEDENE